jgi:hypothetical protein
MSCFCTGQCTSLEKTRHLKQSETWLLVVATTVGAATNSDMALFRETLQALGLERSLRSEAAP